MHDLPRQKLTELLSTHGLGICDDAKRFEGLLKDLLRNAHKRETFVLVSAVREGIVQDLRAPTSGMPLAGVTAKLVRKLRDNLALDEAAARWGVESWALALGIRIAQPVVRENKAAPSPPFTAPTSPPTLRPGEKVVLAASSDGDPSVSSGGNIDLAAMVLYHQTKAEQEKQYAAEIHRQARKLADDANDYESAIQLIESLDAKWRDEQLYRSVCERRDHERDSKAKQHATQVQQQAKQYAKETRDFAGAARMIEEIAPFWRDWKLHEKICGYRDQVARLDADIRSDVENGRLQYVRSRVRELLKLQPKRDDMRRLLEVLPGEPELLTEFTNSIGMQFVLIPPGEFTMGSNETDDEKPPHLVRITRPFYLGVFQVTQAEYQAVTGQNPSHAAGNPRHPVEQVSWENAMTFTQKLSQLSAEQSRGLTYRLPSEAEWEYACRAGSTSKWSFGDQESQLRDFAWFNDNSGIRTHPVGEKEPNSWGLYDMHGNVAEWCLDWYDARFYKLSAADDPRGPASASCRVNRGGGSWGSASSCRSACRSGYPSRSRTDDLGFRVVCEI